MGPLQPESTSRDDQSGAAPKVVVTVAEIASEPVPAIRDSLGSPGGTAPQRAIPSNPRPPVWAVVLTSLSALLLPVLCLTAIGVRLAVRQREPRLRDAWARLLCTLLIASGMVTSVVFAFLLALSFTLHGLNPRSTVSLPPRSLRHTQEFPKFPSDTALNAEQIAAQTRPLVFILSPDPGFAPTPDYLSMAPIGAATLLMADDNGYLFCTSRHVVDEKGLPQWLRRANRMVIFSHDLDYGTVEVIGRHRDLDLAILWEPASGPHARFTQPIARSSEVRTGEPVFVIGHPQRLFFTLSSGLVSRVEDSTIVQFSAPISPGNSGGPVYDASGNLLGIVQSMVDRAQSPNAENLNFAVRSEKLLDANGWDFSGPGKVELAHLRQNQRQNQPKETVPQDQ